MTDYKDYPNLPPPEQPKKPNILIKYFLRMVGLSIFLMGIYLTYNVVNMIRFHADVKNWSATPATILSAKLKKNPGSRRIYTVYGSYQYDIAGKQYTSNRIQYSPKNIDVGDFSQKAHSQLEHHRKTGQSLTVYVNPEEPEQAIVYPKLRKAVLFYNLLIAFFYGLSGFVISRIKILDQEYLDAQENPGEPWRWRPQWYDNTILCDTQKKLAVSFVIAGCLNIFAWPAGLFALYQLSNNSDEIYVYIFLAFPLIGLIPIYFWWKKKQQYKYHGPATLTLNEMPAYIGQKSHATFTSTHNQEEVTSLYIFIICMHKKEVSRGKNTQIKSNVVWRKLTVYPCNNLSRKGDIIFPFDFEIPEGLPASSWQNKKHKIEWEIVVKPTNKEGARTVGFEIPVFN